MSVNPRPPAALAAKAELVARCSSPVLGANCIGVSVMVILLPGLQRERASSAMSKQLERSSSSCHPVVAGGGYKCLWKYYLIITLQSRKYKKCFSFELAKLVISPIIENLMLDFVALPKVIIPLIASDCRLLHKCCLCTQWFFFTNSCNWGLMRNSSSECKLIMEHFSFLFFFSSATAWCVFGAAGGLFEWHSRVWCGEVSLLPSMTCPSAEILSLHHCRIHLHRSCAR